MTDNNGSVLIRVQKKNNWTIIEYIYIYKIFKLPIQRLTENKVWLVKEDGESRK